MTTESTPAQPSLQELTEAPSVGGVEMRPSIYELSRQDLETLVFELGQPPYRARQIWEWLYRHAVDSFDAMTNLPGDLRERLAANLRFHTLTPVRVADSADGLATKVLFACADGQCIETVLMHFRDPADADPGTGSALSAEVDVPTGRHTVCLSTQAGCAMGCVFCATGQMGLVRDLTLGECVEQAVYFQRRLKASGERIGNVVFMGMGEPLANWEATWATVEALADPDGFGIGARRITVSTVGVVPGIRRLAEARLPVRLAVSLHAPDDELRGRLVGINRTYDLSGILAACREYQAKGGRRITFEYVLIAGVNDSPAQAVLLAERLSGLQAHVNLIPLNPTAGSSLQTPTYSQAVAFQEALESRGMPTTLRMRRGIDIHAGCGQLRSRVTAGRMGRSLAVRAEV